MWQGRREKNEDKEIKKQFKSFQNHKFRGLVGRVVTTVETTMNWRRVECVTRYLSSSKGRTQSVEGKKRGREFGKRLGHSWLSHALDFRGSNGIFLGISHDDDEAILKSLFKKKNLSHSCIFCLHLYFIPWISPHPQRWHFGLWVEGVGGDGHQEARDPAWQCLEENKDTY